MLEDLNESLGDLDEGLPEPSDLLANLPLITTKKCYFVDLIIMVLSTFE